MIAKCWLTETTDLGGVVLSKLLFIQNYYYERFLKLLLKSFAMKFKCKSKHSTILTLKVEVES